MPRALSIKFDNTYMDLYDELPESKLLYDEEFSYLLDAVKQKWCLRRRFFNTHSEGIGKANTKVDK